VTAAVLTRAVERQGDGFALDPAALAAAPREIGLRALARILMLVSGQTYRPRFERLERLFDRLVQGTMGGGCTLHGCRLVLAPKAKAVPGPKTAFALGARTRRHPWAAVARSTDAASSLPLRQKRFSGREPSSS